MLPPRIVYSLAIRNRTSQKVTVEVSYTDADDNVSTARISVPANGSAKAPGQNYRHGSAIFAKEITKVAIAGAAVQSTSATLSAPFPAVSSPTENYPIEIITKKGGLAITSKYSQ